MLKRPNLLLVNDLSCVGKVALSLAQPIISALQVEAFSLPTVLLSTHTAFEAPFIKPLNDEIRRILTHFSQLDLTFDATLTGYFGNEDQIEQFLTHYPNTKRLIVDPIMADHGKLYRHFSHSFPEKMCALAKHADLLLPNLTEACLLANVPYLESYTQQDIEQLLIILAHKLNIKTIIVTGIVFQQAHIGAMLYEKGRCTYYATTAIPQNFFGTGDLFSALISAFYVHHIPFSKSIPFTLQFIVDCLHDTLTLQRDKKMGILFENQLHQLTSFLEVYHHDSTKT